MSVLLHWYYWLVAAHTACEKSNLGWPTSFFLSYLVIFGVVFFPPQRFQAGETTRIPQRHCRLAHGVSQCFIYDSIHPSLLALCVVVFMQRKSWLTAPMAFYFSLCQETVAISDTQIICLLRRVKLFFFSHILCTLARCLGNACFISAKLSLWLVQPFLHTSYAGIFFVLKDCFHYYRAVW